MVPSVIVAPVSHHSVKPLELHETLERYYPDFADSRIELFAREPREGWDAWGDQADGASVEELLEAA
jgi:N6-adenosine-specific RNA methylase IME4